MWKFVTALILISNCCSGLPFRPHWPQYEIGEVIDVYVYNQNPATRQPSNGNTQCTGRNCGLTTNQGNHRHPQYPNSGDTKEMIIVLVPDDYQPNNNNNNPNHRHPNGNFQPTYPSYPHYPSHGNHNHNHWGNQPYPSPYPYPNENFYPSPASPSQSNNMRPINRPDVPVINNPSPSNGANSESPINSISSTTMSIDKMIENVFNTTSEKPAFDIDLRIDS